MAVTSVLARTIVAVDPATQDRVEFLPGTAYRDLPEWARPKNNPKALTDFDPEANRVDPDAYDPEWTGPQVLEWVGDNRDRLEHAIRAERRGRGRKALTRQLTVALAKHETADAAE
jgi:hypothetical protein